MTENPGFPGSSAEIFTFSIFYWTSVACAPRPMKNDKYKAYLFAVREATELYIGIIPADHASVHWPGEVIFGSTLVLWLAVERSVGRLSGASEIDTRAYALKRPQVDMLRELW